MGRKNKKTKAHKKYKNFKRDLRKEIFQVFYQNPKKPINYKQISSALNIQDSGIRTLINEILRDECSKKKLKEVERGKYILVHQKYETEEGIIQITKHGRGFVIIDGRERDVEIPRYSTGTAFWGDRVEISFNKHAKRPSGKVVRILERSREYYVGVLDLSHKFAFCIPSDSKLHVDFFIPLKELNGAEDGDKVIVEMTEWDDPKDNPVAKVIKVLGQPGTHDVEMHAILAEYGLPLDFPDEVVAYAESIDRKISGTEIKKRKDLRKTTTFTIDPDDAKDFDDALSFKDLGKGKYEIGVHIADVAHYMEPGNPLDEEAFKRATSVYLVDRVVPMLPEVLSNELCSLRPGEDKLCFSAIFEMDDKGNISKEWFGRTAILSDRRFTYDEAQEVIETGKGDHSNEILKLDAIAKVLRADRMKLGGIDFDTEEVKFKLDEEGAPIYVFTKVMKDSNRLIEDFMLLANKRVAEFIGKKENAKTFVYRVHDDPNEDKLMTLRMFVSRFGYKMGKPGQDGPLKMIKSLLNDSKDKPEEEIIKQMAIRSMAKAEYSTNNIGHFGLAFSHYSHFTSPIRRYPDVMVHRLLATYLDGGKSASERDYEIKCKHSSLMEKKAVEAERASIKYKQVEFLMGKIGEHFQGVVSGVTNWGIYVELVENKCEGMVSMQNMMDDYYHFDEESFSVKGSKTGNEYMMGTKVEVRVIGADLQKRQLDFEIIP